MEFGCLDNNGAFGKEGISGIAFDLNQRDLFNVQSLAFIRLGFRPIGLFSESIWGARI